MITLFTDLLNWTGANNVSGNQYGFWSGFGSDLTEFGLLVAALKWYQNSRCHVDGCHKRAKYPFKHYKLCGLHHPDVPRTIKREHIKQLQEHP